MSEFPEVTQEILEDLTDIMTDLSDLETKISQHMEKTKYPNTTWDRKLKQLLSETETQLEHYADWLQAE